MYIASIKYSTVRTNFITLITFYYPPHIQKKREKGFSHRYSIYMIYKSIPTFILHTKQGLVQN